MKVSYNTVKFFLILLLGATVVKYPILLFFAGVVYLLSRFEKKPAK